MWDNVWDDLITGHCHPAITRQIALMYTDTISVYF